MKWIPVLDYNEMDSSAAREHRRLAGAQREKLALSLRLGTVPHT